MTFIYTNYIFIVVLFCIAFTVAILWRAQKFKVFVEEFWFAKIKVKNQISIICTLLGFCCLIFSLLDLRGPVKNIETTSVQQKTIIMLDTSPSMLAEDIRPNRFNRALFLIRHLIKSMAGHQISVVLFSDINKQVVPFTEDIDLIEARLSALSDSTYLNGSTNLGKSVMESLQYFKRYSDDLYGNILIFTDAEETGDKFAVDLPEEITLGIVGIGTRKGTTIPIRTRDGVFSGHKRYKGKDVITKLDEKWLKELSAKIKNYQYWIASSYDLPTNDIIKFMTRTDNTKKNKSRITSRPVLYHYLLIPGIFLIILGSLLNFGSQYKPIAFLVSFFICLSSVKAQNMPPGQSMKDMTNGLAAENVKNPPGQLTEEEIEEIKRKQHEAIQKELQVLKKRRYSDQEREIIAEKIKSIGGNEEYNQMMNEILEGKELNQENLNAFFNKYTSDLELGKLGDGLSGLKKIDEYLDENPDKIKDEKLKSKINENIKKALIVAKQQEQQSDQNNKKKSNKDGKGKGKGKQGSEKNKDNNDGQSEDPSEKERNKSAKERKEEQKKKQKQLKQSLSENKMKNLKRKLPAILKQLIDDDRKLQQEMLDTSTDNRKRSYEKKDW